MACAHLIEKNSTVTIRLLGFSQVKGSGLLTQYGRYDEEAGVHLVTPVGIEYHDGEAAI
jgi:hypothetical protein